MKKLLIVLATLALIASVGVMRAEAATTADIAVTVTCRMISVSVSPTSYNFTEVNEGSETVAVSAITVTNNGNVNEDFALKLTNPLIGWTAIQAGTPGENQYILGAMFKSLAPIATDYVDNQDMLSTTSVEATVDIFALNLGADGEKGYNVASAGTRNLWFYFYAPSSTTVGTQQSITVTMTASAT